MVPMVSTLERFHCSAYFWFESYGVFLSPVCRLFVACNAISGLYNFMSSMVVVSPI